MGNFHIHLCLFMKFQDQSSLLSSSNECSVGFKKQRFTMDDFFLTFFMCVLYFYQPGFGYQQQLLPGMRPGGAPMPNFFMPMVQQGQQGQRPGGRRGGAVPVQQGQQPLPLMQQQVSVILQSPIILFFHVTFVGLCLMLFE